MQTSHDNDYEHMEFAFTSRSAEDLGAVMGAELAPTSRHRAIRNCVVVALTLARWQNPLRWLIYPRDHCALTTARSYFGRNFGRGPFLWAVDSLDRAELIEHRKTIPSPVALYRSTLRANTRFALTVPLSGIADLMPYDTEVIVLKDAQKNRVTYKETANTRRWRRDVLEQNEALAAVRISLMAPDRWTIDENGMLRNADRLLNPARTNSYRVFNGNWQNGGRFYGPFWQGLPEADRAHLLIDGEQTAERDFPFHQPTLIAAASGRRLGSDDPYLDCGPPRAEAKTAFNILVNADSHEAALLAMQNRYFELGISKPRERAKAALDGVMKRNPDFRHAWGTGLGRRLQFVDSEMAAVIQQKMRREAGPVLSVHDSFIAQTRFVGHLEAVMSEALDETISDLINGQIKIL